MKKFEKLGKALSKAEQKKIMGGDAPVDGFSCVCTDAAHHSAGMVSCDTCDKWCKDSGYGGKDTCD